jgi:hypothetical protein
MKILMPRIRRHRNARCTALHIPVFARRGEGYDILNNTYKLGGWVKVLSIAVEKEWRMRTVRVAFREVSIDEWAVA